MPAEITARIRAPFQKTMGVLQGAFRPLGWNNNYPQRATNYAGTDEIDVIGVNSANSLLLGGAYARPLGTPIKCDIQANGKIVTSRFFNAGYFADSGDATPLEVTRIDCIFDTANGAALTGYVCKEVSGQAPGAGATCMSGTFNLNATANTLQTATLAGTRGTPSLVLSPGQFLSLKLSTTVTSLAGLSIIVWVRPYTGIPPATVFLAANGDIADMTIYLNMIPGLTVKQVAVSWSTAGSNAGTVTMDIKKDTGTDAPAAGSSILAAAQSVKGTANVTVYPALSATAGILVMGAGDRLSLDMTGTLTALAGLCATVYFEPSVERTLQVSLPCWDALVTDRVVWISDGYYEVVAAGAVWSTASSSGTLQVTKDASTNAPGAGTDLLTSTGFSTAGTANTFNEGTLTSTLTSKLLKPGDRLSIDHAGTTTSLAGLCVAMLLRKQ